MTPTEASPEFESAIQHVKIEPTETHSDDTNSPIKPVSKGAQKRLASELRETTQSSNKKTKAKKLPRGYQGPEAYAHLNLLPDILEPNLDGEPLSAIIYIFGMKAERLLSISFLVIFCGIKSVNLIPFL